MRKHKVSNLHKIILDFNLFNIGSILANNSFRNISFANNGDDQENSTLETVYKSSNQIPEIRTNIECKLVKKKQLTFKEKQIRVT